MRSTQNKTDKNDYYNNILEEKFHTEIQLFGKNGQFKCEWSQKLLWCNR